MGSHASWLGHKGALGLVQKGVPLGAITMYLRQRAERPREIS